jgi:hypothetical protein
MLRQKKSRLTTSMWALAIGATVGLAAGLIVAARSGLFRRGGSGKLDRTLSLLEEQIVDLLSFDSVLGQRSVEVAALAPGIVELTGSVDSEEEAHRAVELAQRAHGVRTVLNRIDVGPNETRLAGNRRRFGASGGNRPPQFGGLGVGTGRRRQGIETEPPQRDDRVDILTHAVEKDAAIDTE